MAGQNTETWLRAEMSRAGLRKETSDSAPRRRKWCQTGIVRCLKHVQTLQRPWNETCCELRNPAKTPQVKCFNLFGSIIFLWNTWNLGLLKRKKRTIIGRVTTQPQGFGSTWSDSFSLGLWKRTFKASADIWSQQMCGRVTTRHLKTAKHIILLPLGGFASRRRHMIYRTHEVTCQQQGGKLSECGWWTHMLTRLYVSFGLFSDLFNVASKIRNSVNSS